MMNFEIRREKNYLMALVLAPIFAVVIILSLLLDGAEYAFYSNGAQDLNYGIIKEFEDARQNADLGIIMMGNSRFRYGTNFGFNPEELVDLPDGRKAAILKFTDNAAVFHTYQAYADAVLLAKPDYVILLDMLFTNMRPRQKFVFVRYSQMVYKAWLYRFQNLSPADVWENRRNDLKLYCYDDYPLSMMNQRIAATASRDYHTLDPAKNRNVDIIRDFVRKALAQGTKVIVMHMPSNTDVLDEYNVPHYYIDSYGMDHVPDHKEMLPDLYKDVIWMSYPAPHDRNSYCDLLHLNDKGRKDFDRWFLQKLQNL